MTKHTFVNRNEWQAQQTARNFPEGGEPFMSPNYIDEEVAYDLFGDSSERNFDTFLAKRHTAVSRLDEQLHTITPHVEEIVYRGITRAISAGYIPITAIERVKPAFAKTAIPAPDQSFFAPSELGTYTTDTDRAALSAEALYYDPEETLAHEVGGHKISGGTFIKQADGTITCTRRGFVTKHGVHFGLDEAVQQHLIVAYTYGEFDVVDPDQRSDSNIVYRDFRKILATYILRSGNIVTLKNIVRSSFEDTDDSNNCFEERRIMVAQARAAYGPGAYYKLNLLFEAVDRLGLTAGSVTERIQPGYIDIEDLPSESTDSIFDEYYD